MQIKGIESMTSQELAREVANGGKFVIYQYAISVVILSFKTRYGYLLRPLHGECGSERSSVYIAHPGGRLVGHSVRADFHRDGPVQQSEGRQGRDKRGDEHP